jgi:hypothetical protein
MTKTAVVTKKSIIKSTTPIEHDTHSSNEMDDEDENLPIRT